jgi:V/A-type H+-transporting ATPase subunit A
MEVLNREGRLQQIVKLVGPDALPDSQKIILRVAEILKNAFMQQNAFDDVDMFASPDKQLLMLNVIMEFYYRSIKMISKGVPLIKINAIKSLPKIIRMRFSVENENTSKLEELTAQMSKELDELERNAK